MTCIVGIVDGSRVHIGGDSASCSNYTNLYLRADQKVFRSGPYVMGFTDSYRMGQLLRFKLKPPPFDESSDPFEYMCGSFVESVRDCLKAGGFARRHDEEERGGQFLVGFRGRLFEVCADYQVAEMISGFNAVGCGAQIALGALEAYATVGAICINPEERVRLALRAAEVWSAGVRAPFHVVSTDAPITL